MTSLKWFLLLLSLVGTPSVRYVNRATTRPKYQPRVASIGDQFLPEQTTPRLGKLSTFSDCQLDSCGIRSSTVAPLSASSNNTPSHFYNHKNNHNNNGNHASTLERRTVRFNDECATIPLRLQNELAGRIMDNSSTANFPPPPFHHRRVLSSESIGSMRPL